MPREPTHEPNVANSPPVIDEATFTDLTVTGTLPPALSGQYLCIGPNDGAAGRSIIHALSLHEGRAVAYRNRVVPTDARTASLVTFGRSIYVVVDGALADELTPDLVTIGPVDFGGGHRHLTAHPKLDPATGELHLLTYATDPSQLHVHVSPGGLTRTVRSIGNAPSRIRELELTQDHVVLLGDGFVGVIRRGAAAEATWFSTDTDSLHLATADGDGETVTVCATGPSLVRWMLHPNTGTVDREVLDATPQRFVVDDRPAAGEARRYLWTAGAGAAHKHDLSAGTRRTHEFAAGCHPGPLVFTTDPARSNTPDGGWLVGFVDDEATNETDFVVLDAQAIERAAVATVHIPRRVPAIADATWITDGQI